MSAMTKLNTDLGVRMVKRSNGARRFVSLMKRSANRRYRLYYKRCIKAGKEIHEKPFLTGWEIA